MNSSKPTAAVALKPVKEDEKEMKSVDEDEDDDDYSDDAD